MGDSSGFSAFCQCLTGKYCLVSKTEMKCLRDLQNNSELFLFHQDEFLVYPKNTDRLNQLVCSLKYVIFQLSHDKTG